MWGTLIGILWLIAVFFSLSLAKISSRAERINETHIIQLREKTRTKSFYPYNLFPCVHGGRTWFGKY